MTVEEGNGGATTGYLGKGGILECGLWLLILQYIYIIIWSCNMTFPSTQMALEDGDTNRYQFIVEQEDVLGRLLHLNNP
jgi:hypothetical protein